MLYTRKGDNGTTKTFGCDQRISKSSIIAEALGTLDEINSFLGICKVKSDKENFSLSDGVLVKDTIHTVQKNLFIIQAELAGSPMSIIDVKVKEVEKIIDAIEVELPPIKSFFISGNTELASFFDVARTVVRRAERRMVAVVEEGKVKISPDTLSYLNRLSSLFYALARFANHKFGKKEESPDYQ
jgi:cob(I)alamin adenosyltransferase